MAIALALTVGLVSIQAAGPLKPPPVSHPPRILAQTPYSVIKRGPFSAIWQKTVTFTNDYTHATWQTNRSYVELSDGLNYLENGQWTPAQDRIELTADGAAALHGQCKVHFSPDLKAAGAVDMQTPDGSTFLSQPSDLYYYDALSGKRVHLASLQHCSGALIPPRSVVYTNAFDNVDGDVLYIYTRGGFEQDIILLEAPSPPSAYGLNPDTTRLEIWTAFSEAPPLQSKRTITLEQETNQTLRAQMVAPDLTDDLLTFSQLWFPVGKAYAWTVPTTSSDSTNGASIQPAGAHAAGEVPVGKRWIQKGGSAVLIESAEYNDLLPHLQGLAQASVSNPATRHKALLSKPMSKRILLAQRDSYQPRRGVVLDYSNYLRKRAILRIFGRHDVLLALGLHRRWRPGNV